MCLHYQYKKLQQEEYAQATNINQQYPVMGFATGCNWKISATFKLSNSIKSDILPVLNIGGHAIHVPYHTTWAHEQVNHKIPHDNFHEVDNISEVLQLLN